MLLGTSFFIFEALVLREKENSSGVLDKGWVKDTRGYRGDANREGSIESWKKTGVQCAASVDEGDEGCGDSGGWKLSGYLCGSKVCL